ncbi:MAG: aspartate aminotransferase family protein [Geminicoccaceae bacterium]|nr:aspartate aminotransferase family protein [Geminicoccaceae bacterium]MDW8370122.1 aspartate aminotransferase family protein [Geminicoccaceae bacterium]
MNRGPADPAAEGSSAAELGLDLPEAGLAAKGLPEGDGNRSAERARFRAERGPAARALLEADERVFFRQVLSTPCLEAVVRAEGPWLETADGQRILDFHGNSVHQLGHGHPRVRAAVARALAELPFCPRRYTNPSAVRLAERLVSAMPGGIGAWKCLLVPSGSLAIGIALKLARLATGRFGTLAFWDSFHGAGLDAASLGGEALFRDGLGPLLPGAHHLPPPGRGPCRFGCRDEEHGNCLAFLDETLARAPEIGVLVAEPVRWTTVAHPPPGYWKAVRSICDRRGVLLVFDEIPASPARSGSLFVFEQLGVVPDMLVLGKGLGGGIWPQAALLARAELDRFPATALGHYTHEKSPAGAAAALATLEVIARGDLLARAGALGRRMQARLEALRPAVPLLREIRALGAMVGVELARPDGTPAVAEAERVLYAALRRGLSFKIGGGNVITLCPPLTIGEDLLDRALDILADALLELAARPSPAVRGPA